MIPALLTDFTVDKSKVAWIKLKFSYLIGQPTAHKYAVISRSGTIQVILLILRSLHIERRAAPITANSATEIVKCAFGYCLQL